MVAYDHNHMATLVRLPSSGLPMRMPSYLLLDAIFSRAEIHVYFQAL